MPEYRKKLIEVALPLESINKESAREKSIRFGHPSTLHLWWARRPLAACRSVLFAQMVDDPSSLPEEFPTEEVQEAERQRLFRIIEEFVKWENITNEAVLHKARVEIARSAARNHGIALPHSMTPAEVADALKRYAPPVLDPFAGGGSIPLEAQRLGLEAHASDINPVAVLINKALIEIPPKFAGRPPVNPESREKYLHKEWKGAEGLAEDIRYYGNWMRDEAWMRIGRLYPKVRMPKEQGVDEATVIAWIWARTVKCPNPACCSQVPLTRTFQISAIKGAEMWVEPIINHANKSVHFTVRQGHSKREGTVSRSKVTCLVCDAPMSLEYIRAEGQNRRMGTRLMAIVAERGNRRICLSPNEEHEAIANVAQPTWEPNINLSTHPQYMGASRYGLTQHKDLFTSRQLVALDTFSELVRLAHSFVITDSDGDIDYADAVATYLGLGVSRLSDICNALCTWGTEKTQVRHLFGRQAIPMLWDFGEANVFGDAAGDYRITIFNLCKALESLPARGNGEASQVDAVASFNIRTSAIISTDPPYYDNVPYADLSDFFYVWLRRSLSSIYTHLFSTVLTPKVEELLADQIRLGGREKAQKFFEQGLGKAFVHMYEVQYPGYPITVYYAFKQVEIDEDDSRGVNGARANASTGWETMLEGLLKSNFSILGTWPIRTERAGRLREMGSNALASSIVLVCRPRPVNAPLSNRRDFLNALKRELPKALRDLQRGNIAPVDLAQAAIGPGMAVFSRYSKVLESDGTSMRVRTALQLINQMLDEVLAEQEGEYDADTRWAVAWFEQYGMEEGPYGVAETLSKAKNTAVGTLVEAGILRAQGGKVRLLRRNEFSSNWNPATAKRLTVWEVTQRLIRALQEQGDAGAAAILDHVGAYGEIARDLAYRLYTVCERKKWADEALAYNSLVVEWSDISGAAEQLGRTTAEQARLFS